MQIILFIIKIVSSHNKGGKLGGIQKFLCLNSILISFLTDMLIFFEMFHMTLLAG